MRILLLGGLIMLFSQIASADDCFEVVSHKFNDGVTLDKQKRLMEKLNDIVKTFDGFKSRDYYYSKENGRWIDFVVWESLEKAKKASEQAMQNSEAGKVFSQIEEKSMIFSHYDRVGGIGKK